MTFSIRKLWPFGRKPVPRVGVFNTIIGVNTEITSTIGSKAMPGQDGETVRVDGIVSGSIIIDGENGTVIISTGAKVLNPEAVITADHIIVNGEVKVKHVTANHSFEVTGTGRITAETISYGSLKVEEGALITSYIRDGGIE